MSLMLHIRITGLLLVVLACAHLFFPRYFKWRAQLGMLSLINRQMMKVHTLFIAVTVLLMGVLCLTSATELISTPLGRRISLGLAFFWALRLVVQFFGYSSSLWRGKALETAVHILFSLAWAYITTVFAFASAPTD